MDWGDLWQAAVTAFTAVGAWHMYKQLRVVFSPRCGCCTNGDSCDCEKHCPKHRGRLPRAVARTRRP